ILRIRFFFEPTVAPTEVPVASDFFAMEGLASSLCKPGGGARRESPRARFGPFGTPKTPQAHQPPSGAGAPALETWGSENSPLPRADGRAGRGAGRLRRLPHGRAVLFPV